MSSVIQPIKKLILTSVQKGCRITYALKYLQWDDADWLDVLWSDEVIFTVTEGRGGSVVVIPLIHAIFVEL